MPSSRNGLRPGAKKPGGKKNEGAPSFAFFAKGGDFLTPGLPLD